LPGTPAPVLAGSLDKGTGIAQAADVDFFVENKTPLTRGKRKEIADRLLGEVQKAFPAGLYCVEITRRAFTLRSKAQRLEYPDVDVVYALIRHVGP
jgi:hypothetical protein